MNRYFVKVIVAVFVFSFLTDAAEGSEKNTAKCYAGTDELLNREEAALYLANMSKEPLSKFLEPGQMVLDAQKVVSVMAYKLDDLRTLTGHEAPWTWQELDSLYGGMNEKQKNASISGWKNIVGFTKIKPLGAGGEEGSLGPVSLRKSEADLLKPLKCAKGITIGFSDNRLVNGHGAWNTQGVLGYPLKYYSQGGPGASTEFALSPVINWKLVEIEGVNSNDLQELGFSLPFTLFKSPGGRKRTGTYEENIAAAKGDILSALWIFDATPYFQTDFEFLHKIYGFEASCEYVGGVFGSNFYMGGFQNTGSSGVQYQLRIVPKIDYSFTQRDGKFTTRQKGDDFFRAGGMASLDFRLGEAEFNALDIGASYHFFESFGHSSEYSDLFRSYVTCWLSENTGMTLEYSKGETPVSLKNIDLITLGLEFKY